MTREPLLSRYRALLKPLPIEGIPDLILFRPIAFLLVQVLKELPVTPNQVSFSAISTGLLSGFCFALGTHRSFAVAGLLYGLTAVLDCADGMLARLKKSGTPLGRVIDGAVDFTNALAVMAGLAIGVARAGVDLPLPAVAITALAGVSLAIHCLVVDHFRCQYAFHALGVKGSVLEDIRAHGEIFGTLKARGGHHLLRLILGASLAYDRLQSRIAPRRRPYEARAYARLNTPTLRAWQMIELSMHIVVLAISALLFRPGIFFFYTIVVANIWLLIMVPLQFFADRRVAALSRGAGPPQDGHASSNVIS